MSNTPEKIWAIRKDGGNGGIYTTNENISMDDRLVEYIRADLVPQWQPIETAPKDGREFLACYGRCNNAMHLVSYNRIHSYWQSKGEYVGGFMQNATAWCDFTPPPAT